MNDGKPIYHFFSGPPEGRTRLRKLGLTRVSEDGAVGPAWKPPQEAHATKERCQKCGKKFYLSAKQRSEIELSLKDPDVKVVRVCLWCIRHKLPAKLNPEGDPFFIGKESPEKLTAPTGTDASGECTTAEESPKEEGGETGEQEDGEAQNGEAQDCQ